MESIKFGKRVEEGERRHLFGCIAKVLSLHEGDANFIGSHPISLDKKGLKYLLSEDYLVCEKSDGIRIMLFVCNSVVYLYDRMNTFYQTRYCIRTKETFLLDGEMYQEGDSSIYAIFDTLISGGIGQTDKCLLKRLSKAQAFVQWLAGHPDSLQISNDSTYRKFKITVKQMTKGHGFHQVLDAIPSLKHKNDGLIFTPVDEQYIIGGRSRTLKWKPAHLNTVDLAIKMVGGSHAPTYDLLCYATDFQQPRSHRTKETGSILVRFASLYQTEITESIDGAIGEFYWDPCKLVVDMADYSMVEGGWSLYKIRTDKTAPNNIKVVLNVLHSIRENISEKDLLALYEPIYQNYKKRHRESDPEPN